MNLSLGLTAAVNFVYFSLGYKIFINKLYNSSIVEVDLENTMALF